MLKLSNLISKKLYSLYEGICVGTIINVNIKNYIIKGVYVLSLDEENVYFVNKKDIFSFGQNTLNIKNVSKLQSASLEGNSLINKQAVFLCGEECGKINDAFFDNNFNLIAVLTNLNVVIPKEKILHIGQDAVFFGESEINIAKFRPKFSFNLNVNKDYKVSALEQAKNSTLFKIESSSFQKPTIPQKVKQNPNFLIGRTVSSSIKDQFGENIIKEGQKITEKVISKAQLSNKIYELSRCVK